MKVKHLLEAKYDNPKYRSVLPGLGIWGVAGIPGDGRGSIARHSWLDENIFILDEDGYDDDDDDDDWDDFGHRWQAITALATEEDIKEYFDDEETVEIYQEAGIPPQNESEAEELEWYLRKVDWRVLKHFGIVFDVEKKNKYEKELMKNFNKVKNYVGQHLTSAIQKIDAKNLIEWLDSLPPKSELRSYNKILSYFTNLRYDDQDGQQNDDWMEDAHLYNDLKGVPPKHIYGAMDFCHRTVKAFKRIKNVHDAEKFEKTLTEQLHSNVYRNTSYYDIMDRLIIEYYGYHSTPYRAWKMFQAPYSGKYDEIMKRYK